jgi:hypothetical protein
MSRTDLTSFHIPAGDLAGHRPSGAIMVDESLYLFGGIDATIENHVSEIQTTGSRLFQTYEPLQRILYFACIMPGFVINKLCHIISGGLGRGRQA